MEVKHAKHVTISCSLKPGDMVKLSQAYGSGIRPDAQWMVADIKYTPSCESGFMVFVRGDDFPRGLDSNWVDKV